MRAPALLAALLLPALAGAQPSSRPTRRPTKPNEAPDPEREAKLRREAGALELKLVAVHSAPREETARLSIDVYRQGNPIDRTRVVDVSRVRRPDGLDLRIRFRDPPQLRGEAHLIRVRRGKPTLHYRYDPKRHTNKRAPPPTWSDRLAGTGLTWGDLRGERFQAHTYTFEADAKLQVPPLPPPATGAGKPTEVETRRVRAIPSDKREPVRVLHLDRARHVPILERTLDAKGKTVRLVWRGKYKPVGKKLRPFVLVIDEPKDERQSVIRVKRRATKVPAYHLDPPRYFNE